MNITAHDVIESALTEIGVLGPGDPITAEDGKLALFHMNMMIEDNNICASSIFTTRSDLYVLTANKQSYTLGSDPAGVLTPDLAGTRPTAIKFAYLYLQNSPVLKRRLNILTDAQWADKRYLYVFTYPSDLYSDGGYPFTTLYFYPAPNAAYTVELWTWQQGGEITALTGAAGEVNFPPGYKSFWHYNLCERLCGPFAKSLSESQQKLLLDANERIISNNSANQNPVKKTGSGLRGFFNWKSGDFTR